MTLEDVRTEIQDIDLRILDLMRRRLELARLVGEDKVSRNAAVRNIPQENKVIDRYRGYALENGMNPVYAEQVCRILMQESIEIQASLPRTAARMRHSIVLCFFVMPSGLRPIHWRIAATRATTASRPFTMYSCICAHSFPAPPPGCYR